MNSENNRVVLFVDLLGVRASWLKGGRDEAEKAFSAFRNMIATSLMGDGAESLVSGLVESDAAALTFKDLPSALAVAKDLYLATFRHRKHIRWLRGCIVGHNEESDLRKPTLFRSSLSKVELMLYSGALLDAISVEKSGYKGMRLLVERKLITPEITAAIRQQVGHLNFIPLCILRGSTYPKRLQDSFMDYLWMGTTDRDSFGQLKKIMAVRLRRAAKEPEEFMQAAATQVMFHECAAILSSLGGKAHYQELKSSPNNLASDNVTEVDGDSASINPRVDDSIDPL